MEIVPQFVEEDKEKPKMVSYVEKYGSFETGKQYTQRIAEIADLLVDDEKGLEFLNALLNDVGEYVHSVFNNETQTKFLSFRLEGDDLRNAVKNLDETQHRSHNRLIDDIRVLNRYLFQTYKDQVPAGGVCPISPEGLKHEDRDEIAAWAISIAAGYLVNRLS